MLYICQKVIFLIFGMNYIHSQGTHGHGYCAKNESVKTTNGTITDEKMFCCRHFEERNNKCTECKEGYTSEKGNPCQPCAQSTYGPKCAFTCKCQDNQRCHHENGCIANVTTTTNKENDQRNIAECKAGYTSEEGKLCQPCALGTYGQNCAFTCECQDNQRCHRQNGCIAVYIAEVTTSASGNKENDQRTVAGLNVREIIVYLVCAGVFVIAILLCILYHRRNQNNKTESRKGRNKPDSSSPDVPLGETEGMYDLINESNMIENLANVGLNSSTVPNTSRINYQSNSNVYLTPYEPGGDSSGSNSDNLNGNKFESSTTTNTSQQTTNARHSTSLNYDKQGRRTSHSNLHQPVIHPVDIDNPEYLFTRDTSDSGSSGSETQMTESGYLNPYQPIMLPVTDSHEYKSLHGCSNN